KKLILQLEQHLVGEGIVRGAVVLWIGVRHRLIVRVEQLFTGELAGGDGIFKDACDAASSRERHDPALFEQQLLVSCTAGLNIEDRIGDKCYQNDADEYDCPPDLKISC